MGMSQKVRLASRPLRVCAFNFFPLLAVLLPALEASATGRENCRASPFSPTHPPTWFPVIPYFSPPRLSSLPSTTSVTATATVLAPTDFTKRRRRTLSPAAQQAVSEDTQSEGSDDGLNSAPDEIMNGGMGGNDETATTTNMAGIGARGAGLTSKNGAPRPSTGAASVMSNADSFMSVTTAPGKHQVWTPPSTPPTSHTVGFQSNVPPGSTGRSTLAAPDSTRSYRSARSSSIRSAGGSDTEVQQQLGNGHNHSSTSLTTPTHSRNGTPSRNSHSRSPSPSLRPLPQRTHSSASSSNLSLKPLPAHPPQSNSMTPSTSNGDMTYRRSSNATSNSSAMGMQDNHPNTLNSSVMSNGNGNAKGDPMSELDATALLIKKLYARLDTQGVPGDGYEEGRERSRDGIINREGPDGGETWKRGMGRPNLSLAGNGEGANRLSVLESVLPLKEEQILKRVDRYGFFSSSHPAALACQHNRLATLDAASYSVLSTSKSRSSSKAPSLASSTNSRLSNSHRHKTLSHRASTASLMPALTPTDMALETKRIDKWATMLTVAKRDSGNNSQEWVVGKEWWDGRKSGNGKYRKLQRRVFKGVPDRWRRAVWGLEMERMATEVKSKGKQKVMSLEELAQEYRTFVDLPSNQDIQIDLDVPRTISGHVLFHTRYGQGQRALFHVLHAFGLHCEDIGGYCQGMGPIAATFLCYFEPERAYACLVRLFYQYGLRHIFEEGFPGLVEAFYVQEKLVELLMPDVHKAFMDHGISTSSYATKWYITLFANSVPFATQLRFWDGLLLEGIDFTIITAVAVIWCFRGNFTAPDASFESILSALSSYFLVESDDALLRWIRKTLRRTDLRKKMEGWRQEWQGFVQDGSSSKRVT